MLRNSGRRAAVIPPHYLQQDSKYMLCTFHSPVLKKKWWMLSQKAYKLFVKKKRYDSLSLFYMCTNITKYMIICSLWVDTRTNRSWISCIKPCLMYALKSHFNTELHWVKKQILFRVFQAQSRTFFTWHHRNVRFRPFPIMQYSTSSERHIYS